MNLTARHASARARLVEEVADAAAKWGYEAPEDPGVTELADGLVHVVDRLRGDHDERTQAASHLEAAVEHLRAAARLGGLLPLVVHHHLRLALRYLQSAGLGIERSALPVT
ncbi:hypothetical protein ACFV4X_12810 [Streptomyces ardesiacus]|uniref:hypothetical protein n=1 Tax=Streptomyces ardesiacus TaxID=285564 RepID=UPI0036643217